MYKRRDEEIQCVSCYGEVKLTTMVEAYLFVENELLLLLPTSKSTCALPFLNSET